MKAFIFYIDDFGYMGVVDKIFLKLSDYTGFCTFNYFKQFKMFIKLFRFPNLSLL